MRTLHKLRYQCHKLRTASVPIQACDFCTVIKPNLHLFTERSLSFQSRTQFKASSIEMKIAVPDQVKYYARKL